MKTIEDFLETLNKAKAEYEIQKRATEQWFNYIYKSDRTKYSDDFYNIRIEDEEDLTVHLPTIVNAMEGHQKELYERYIKLLKKVNVDVKDINEYAIKESD